MGVRLDGVPVVTDVGWEAEAGGWLALIGPNGSGKSTLIRACAGLVRYTGRITIGDTELGSLKARDRARLVAYVPQEPVLPPDMTVTDYVLLGRTPHIGYFGNASAGDRAIAESVMDCLDVARYARRPLARLSGGERQRVVLARALAQRPAVLLLDEPTSMLDIGHEQSVLELVDELRRGGEHPGGHHADSGRPDSEHLDSEHLDSEHLDRGLTVLSALHDLTLAGQYADRLVLLDQGHVAAAGPPAEVLTGPLIERVYAARVTVTAGADGTPVVAPVRAPRPRGR